VTPESIFTDRELAYLAAQRLGRMATVHPDGTPQVNPVSVYYNAALRCLDIGGRAMASSRKFRNVRANARVAVVIDDIASVQPLQVRCLEIRGQGQALTDPDDSAATVPGAIIRIHPRRIISWGIDPLGSGRGRRNVPH
jgi:pyridoxamine 5'-phosphate oxidase family protein